MSKGFRRVFIGIAVLMVLGVAGYLNRAAIALKFVSVAAGMRPIGAFQEVAWSTGLDPAGRVAEDRPPNIVLILADDLGWNDLTFQGGGVAGGTVPTPNIDSIATDGVNFVNGYAANATCAPSRAALMSGRYGTRFGFEFTPTPPGMMEMVRLAGDASGLRDPIVYPGAESVPYEDMGMPPSEITIAELLREQQYHTAHIGKWHLGRNGGMGAHDQGFEESLLMSSGLYLPEDHPEVVNSKQNFDPIDKFLWAAMRYAASFNGGSDFAPDRYLTDYYTEEAVKVIEANKDRPFFLYLAHWAPHTPLQATREDYEALSHIENHRLRVYAAMIRSLDRGVGQVLEALRDNGLEDNTIVMFTSDNGGAHYIGIPEVNQPFRGWKISLFEGGIHVPFFIKWPGHLTPGTVVEAPVHHFDLYSTAAAAAGAPLPSDRVVDGVDLVPFATGERTGAPHESLFWRSGTSQTAIVNGWKLNVSDPPGRDWLFDLSVDPNERDDLSATNPEKLAQLKAALAVHNASQIEPAWPSRASMPINIDKDLTQPDAPDDEFIYWSN
ncbi:MAG: sulfatase-like hydrolase/transferase [Candidatus Binatia bacterium]|nr:sulfatase-like hydrolase/transferase [Candidatus Binatia bacterium]MDG2008587.1 sulfatase-like hydrolase/transferase [Candidatus Binatia bacterium]